MEIKLTLEALGDVQNIQEYLTEHPVAFQSIVQRFNVCFKIIKNHPQIGKEGRRQGTCEFFVSKTNYFIVYRIKPNLIEVLTILHSSKKY